MSESGQGADGELRIDFVASPGDLKVAVETARRGIAAFGAEARVAFDQLDKAGQRQIMTLLKQADTVGYTRQQQIAYNAALKGTPTAIIAELEKRLTASGAAAQQAGKKFNEYGLSAAQQAAALRGVPAQLSDIIVSLQGGQAPLTVLLQQGGQLKDMFGGVVPAARALGSAALGLINPITLTAAAVGVAAVAYNQGASEAQRFATAIAMTGNYAGVSQGQFAAMRREVAVAAGTQGQATTALEQLAATGKIAGAQMVDLSTAIVKTGKVTSTTTEEMVQRFVDLGDEPVKASLKLNEQYHYLTASVLRQIAALEDQGRMEEAGALAQRTYAQEMSKRADTVSENLGFIEKGWNAITSAAKGAWDAMLGIGRASEDSAKLESARVFVSDAQKAFEANRNNPRLRAQYEKAQATIAQLEAKAKAQAEEAQQRAADASKVQALGEWTKAGDQFKTRTEKMNDEIVKARALAKEAGVSAQEIEQRIAQIRIKHADKGAASKAHALAGADRKSDISEIQNAVREYIALNDIESSRLDAARQSGVINEQAYYQRKREILDDSTAAEMEAYRKQNERLRGEKATGKDRIDLDRQIADNDSKMTILRAQSAAKRYEIDQQEIASLRAREAAYQAAKNAQQDELDSLSRQYDRRLQSLTLGSRSQQLMADLNNIDDRAQSRIRDLNQNRQLAQMQGKWSGESEEDYQRQLELIQQFRRKQQDEARKAYDAETQLRESWSAGAAKSWADYQESAADVFGQTRDLVSNTFSGMEDAIVQFVTTGKASFSSFASSVLADMARIAARQATVSIISSIASAYFGGSSGGAAAGSSAGSGTTYVANGGAFGQSGRVSAFAKGSAFTNGVFSSPTLFRFASGGAFRQGVMGEAGPEAVMPLDRTSDGRLGVAMTGATQSVFAPTVQVNVQQAQGETSEQTGEKISRQVMKRMEEVADARIQNALRAGGALANARS
ncbi:MAG: phage tail tape measure protein [Rhodocyclaceae bacterium]